MVIGSEAVSNPDKVSTAETVAPNGALLRTFRTICPPNLAANSSRCGSITVRKHLGETGDSLVRRVEKM